MLETYVSWKVKQSMGSKAHIGVITPKMNFVESIEAYGVGRYCPKI